MSRRRIAVPIAVLFALAPFVLAGPAPASPARPVAHAASTCSDYSNQAAAQRAADTRDPDHDGVYCESLPCPCAKPGSGSTAPTPLSTTTPTGLGHSVTLGRVRRRTGCHVRGSLPDKACTPGARFSRVTTAQVCRSHYSSAVRHVSSSTKASIYARYGMTRHFDGRTGEVDHLVSLELGGSNSAANLWPEAAGAVYGSLQKDRLENRLHSEVCAGRITLRAAQRAIARNWVASYRKRFG